MVLERSGLWEMGDQSIKSMDQPRFAVLTPRGRGAVATIGVRGKEVAELVGRRFKPANGKELETFALGRAIYGRFRSAAASAAADEDVVVGILGEGELEIHCHGGEAAARAICEAMLAEGGTEESMEAWAGNSCSDEIAAEALLALANVRTERGAAILLDQHRGALAAEMERIENLLAGGQRERAKEGIQQLLKRAEMGLHLTQPWKVVLAGEPNAGKSSLMNALVGYERSIVWAEPGTTRDVLVATTAMDGWPIELCDVAGLRGTHDALEAAGIERAEQQIGAADLVVLVADVIRPWNAELHREICERSKARDVEGQSRVLVVHSKCDLGEVRREGRPEGVATSALQGRGLAELCAAIVEMFVTEPLTRGMGVPFNERQVKHLEELGELVGLRSQARWSHPTS
jgi:tRNA modification GTPase